MAGAAEGALYGVVRPVLPRRPELAGVIYGLAAAVSMHALANRLLVLGGLQPRKLRVSDITGAVLFGLWLARSERLLR